MTRNKKAYLTMVVSLINQVATMVCGFILPRFFISNFGSSINGLVSSITQFLAFISLAECGVGAVVRSTLYKPLAVNDETEISKIVISSDRFFKKIAYILVAYTLILMGVYPFVANNKFDFIFTSSLILIISISSFAQYYFGMTYKLLLAADQCGFITLGLQCATVIINTVLCMIMMKLGMSVHIVKLVSSIVFLVQPLVINIIARKRYKIDRTIKLTEEPIKQKWNGLAQHISSVVLGNTDVIVLTLLSSLENVSIYSVYHLVVVGVKNLVDSTTNGIQALLGNMIAKKETEILNETYDSVEWLLHTLTTFVFTSTALLVVPFVSVYTFGVEDANYKVPLFAYLITAAYALMCYRLPYSIIILAAGHFKQTQTSAIVEAVLNIVVSVALVYKFGLIGVAIGTVVSMAYRTIYFVIYLSKNIINRKVGYFIKHILIDAVTIIIVFVVVNVTNESFWVMNGTNYLAWIGLAMKIAVLTGSVVVVINFIFYRSNLMKYGKSTAAKLSAKFGRKK